MKTEICSKWGLAHVGTGSIGGGHREVKPRLQRMIQCELFELTRDSADGIKLNAPVRLKQASRKSRKLIDVLKASTKSSPCSSDHGFE